MSRTLGLPDLSALPALETVPCEDCGGEGGLEDFQGDTFTCASCNGSGEVERCSGCKLQPGVMAGLEVCGCAHALQLRVIEFSDLTHVDQTERSAA